MSVQVVSTCILGRMGWMHWGDLFKLVKVRIYEILSFVINVYFFGSHWSLYERDICRFENASKYIQQQQIESLEKLLRIFQYN